MSAVIEAFDILFDKDLDQLTTELETYESETQLWQLKEGIGNSGGTLALHLCGNLQHFFGHVIGGSDYQRDREMEFSKRHVSLSDLKEEIGKSRLAVKRGLAKLTPDLLEEMFPIEVFGHPMTYGYFLIRLVAHFDYHLGQINYHRRLLK